MLNERQKKAFSIITVILTLKRQGYRAKEIAIALNERGMKTITDKPFSASNVWQIIFRMEKHSNASSYGIIKNGGVEDA